MPKLGSGIESIDNLSQNKYALKTTNKILINKKNIY